MGSQNTVTLVEHFSLLAQKSEPVAVVSLPAGSISLKSSKSDSATLQVARKISAAFRCNFQPPLGLGLVEAPLSILSILTKSGALWMLQTVRHLEDISQT